MADDRDFQTNVSFSDIFETILQRYCDHAVTAEQAERAVISVMASVYIDREIDEVSAESLEDYIRALFLVCRMRPEMCTDAAEALSAIANAAYCGARDLSAVVKGIRLVKSDAALSAAHNKSRFRPAQRLN